MNQEQLINNAARQLKANPSDIEKRVEGLLNRIKEQEREIDRLRNKVAANSINSLLESKKAVGAVNCIVSRVEGLDIEGLRNMVDNLKDRLKSGVIVLAAVNDDRVIFSAGATKDVVAQGVHVGNLLRETAKITGGGGGGRPDMAQAGGKDAGRLEEALNQVEAILAKQLGIGS